MKTKIVPCSPGEVGESPGLDMSSLIDIAFLMLIYFLATSTLLPKESDLGLTLPTAIGEGILDRLDTLQIEIKEDGSVVANDEVVSVDRGEHRMAELKQRLAMFKAASELMGASPVVELAAHDASKCQRFADVLNALTEEEIQNVVLQDFRRSRP